MDLENTEQFIRNNQYDIFITKFIEIYTKQRLNYFWGITSINTINYSYYVPEFLKTNEYNNWKLSECKIKLEENLKQNRVSLKLNRSLNITLLSNKFTDQQMSSYQKNAIIYSLLN